MHVIERLTDQNETEAVMQFHCPGCKYGHSFRIKSGDPSRPVWDWNGSYDKPTFSPSLLVNGRWPESRCHSFVRDGMIQFLDDCWHDKKNQTLPLPPINET